MTRAGKSRSPHLFGSFLCFSSSIVMLASTPDYAEYTHTSYTFYIFVLYNCASGSSDLCGVSIGLLIAGHCLINKIDE